MACLLRPTPLHHIVVSRASFRRCRYVVKAASEIIPGSLILKMDDKSLGQQEAHWKPNLGEEDDLNWNWREFVAGRETEYGFSPDQFLEGWALWHDAMVQGMMILSGPHICVSQEHVGKRAVYVEYLAIAPWNRPSVRNKGHCLEISRLTKVGTALLTHAILRSQALTMDGRVALESIQSAKQRYREMFLRECGREPLDCGETPGGGTLLEMSALQAAEWCHRLGLE